MNFESRGLHAETAEAGNTVWIDDAAAETRRRRWMMLAAALLILAVLAGAYFAMSGGGGEPTAAKGATAGEAASANAADKGSAPTVTVIVPGTTSVERVISSTGTLAARREMPVGVAGEGGQVVRVLVEPGQWVREGQVLATVDRAVQVQQTEQLAAQIRVAEADARLAQSELDRAQALWRAALSRKPISSAVPHSAMPPQRGSASRRRSSPKTAPVSAASIFAHPRLALS